MARRLLQVALLAAVAIAGSLASEGAIATGGALRNAIYYVPDDFDACVLLLNATGHVGCSGGGATGRLEGPAVEVTERHVTGEETVAPGSVGLVAPSLLARVLEGGGLLSRTLAGVVVLGGGPDGLDVESARFSPASTSPLAECAPAGTRERNWNPSGAGLLGRSLTLPVLLASARAAAELLERARADVSRRGGAAGGGGEGARGPSTFVRAGVGMAAAGARNSSECIEDASCLPLGGYSVLAWPVGPPPPGSELAAVSGSEGEGGDGPSEDPRRAPLPTLLLSAPSDGSGLFHARSTAASPAGSESGAPLAALILAAQLLGEHARRPGVPPPRARVGALAAAGQPYGHLGVRRLLFDAQRSADARGDEAAPWTRDVQAVLSFGRLGGEAAEGRGGEAASREASRGVSEADPDAHPDASPDAGTDAGTDIAPSRPALFVHVRGGGTAAPPPSPGSLAGLAPALPPGSLLSAATSAASAASTGPGAGAVAAAPLPATQAPLPSPSDFFERVAPGLQSAVIAMFPPNGTDGGGLGSWADVVPGGSAAGAPAAAAVASAAEVAARAAAAIAWPQAGASALRVDREALAAGAQDLLRCLGGGTPGLRCGFGRALLTPSRGRQPREAYVGAFRKVARGWVELRAEGEGGEGAAGEGDPEAAGAPSLAPSPAPLPRRPWVASHLTLADARGTARDSERFLFAALAFASAGAGDPRDRNASSPAGRCVEHAGASRALRVLCSRGGESEAGSGAGSGGGGDGAGAAGRRTCVGERDLPGVAGRGWCLESVVEYAPAYPTELRYERRRGRWAVGDAAERDAARAWAARLGLPPDPLWAESNWAEGTPSLEVFLEEAQARREAVTVAGVAATAIAAVLAAAARALPRR